MPSPRKKSTANGRPMELWISWMLGCLLLLISNQTVFRSYEASIGDPWLNLVLSAVILVLLYYIAKGFVKGQRESVLAASGIRQLDEASDEEFADTLQEAFQRSGWLLEERSPSDGQAAMFVLTKDQRYVGIVLRKSRRKLTHPVVQELLEELGRTHPDLQDRLLLTNGEFTRQARQWADQARCTLWSRKELVEFLSRRRRFL